MKHLKTGYIHYFYSLWDILGGKISTKQLLYHFLAYINTFSLLKYINTLILLKCYYIYDLL